jgi:hypothetical protein
MHEISDSAADFGLRVCAGSFALLCEEAARGIGRACAADPAAGGVVSFGGSDRGRGG